MYCERQGLRIGSGKIWRITWVRKYETKGTDGLIDRRGKAKPESELTEADKLRMENKILQAKIKDREMEIEILKKLRELRGGGR